MSLAEKQSLSPAGYEEGAGSCFPAGLELGEQRTQLANQKHLLESGGSEVQEEGHRGTFSARRGGPGSIPGLADQQGWLVIVV